MIKHEINYNHMNLNSFPRSTTVTIDRNPNKNHLKTIQKSIFTMQKQINPKPSKCLTMLCPLLFISFLTMLIFSSNASYPQFTFKSATNDSNAHAILPYSLHTQITDLQTQVGFLLQQLHPEK